MKPVRWLDAALVDLEEIVEEIARNSVRAAERFSSEVFTKTDKLEKFPYLGAVCPYHRRVRHLIHGNYVLYYTVHRKETVIRAVVHGFRHFRSAWLRLDK